MEEKGIICILAGKPPSDPETAEKFYKLADNGNDNYGNQCVDRKHSIAPSPPGKKAGRYDDEPIARQAEKNQHQPNSVKQNQYD